MLPVFAIELFHCEFGQCSRVETVNSDSYPIGIRARDVVAADPTLLAEEVLGSVSSKSVLSDELLAISIQSELSGRDDEVSVALHATD